MDTRLNGSVHYQTYNSTNPSNAQVIDRVADFVNEGSGSITNANWMLVATWEAVHPYDPFTDTPWQEIPNPYYQSVSAG